MYGGGGRGIGRPAGNGYCHLGRQSGLPMGVGRVRLRRDNISPRVRQRALPLGWCWLACLAVDDLTAVWQLLALPPQATDPLVRLAAMAEAQRVLAAAVDSTVLAAVSAGASWGEIGRATGRTRQGARQRWIRLVAPPSPLSAEMPDPLPVSSAGKEPLPRPWDLRPPPGGSWPELPSGELSVRIAVYQARHDEPPDDPWPPYPRI